MKTLQYLFSFIVLISVIISCNKDETEDNKVKVIPSIPAITANSFIVAPGASSVVVPINNVNVFWNKGGDGAIATEMGNTWSTPNLDAPAVANNVISDNTYKVEVIWTDIAEGVNIVFDKTATDFTVTGIPSTPGNIVVGVKNAGTEYLWSWHLWITDYDPSDPANQIMLPNKDKTIAMDRDLGAINATIADVGSFGLFYQWGRKDPFPAAKGVKDNAVRETYPSALPDVAKGGKGTLLKGVQNPNVFYGSNSDYITLGHLNQDKGNNRWGGEESPFNRTPIKGVKSIYDPCPEGWRMPWGANWSGFIKDDTQATPIVLSNLVLHLDDFDTYPGRTYTDSDSGKTTWFPASGYRDRANGSIYNVSDHCYGWSGSSFNNTNAYYLYFYSEAVHPSSNNNRAFGYPVRPVQDIPSEVE